LRVSLWTGKAGQIMHDWRPRVASRRAERRAMGYRNNEWSGGVALVDVHRPGNLLFWQL
jgi:hypothetical protein